MAHLTRAHQELFRRTPDEQFASLAALTAHCRDQRDNSLDRWELPHVLRPAATVDHLQLGIGDDGTFLMNDWSFGQLCKLARVKKQTINRLRPDTAKRVFHETLPAGHKPLQLLVHENRVRSIHAASYTRLDNAELLEIVQEFAGDFQPPQKAGNGSGGTGLYCGEQDMFCFMIDPTGWAEIDGQAFAPGFFIWNSEVGRRALGIETFWFQSVCANHLVWDAVETVEFSRKHTTNVHEALSDIRRIIEGLVAKRNKRRDGFVKVIRKSMQTKLGAVTDDVALELAKQGVSKAVAKKALEIAQQQGGFTIFALVDALTRLAGQVENAGDRIDADKQAASILALAA
jgi:hypothetical protein